MKKIGNLKVHPVAEIVPMAIESEQAALTANIKEFGQLESIKLYRGAIVDGRCRATACLTLGIEPKVFDLPNNTKLAELEEIAIGASIHRNLTPTQKAIIAYKLWKKQNKKAKAYFCRIWSTSRPQFLAAQYLQEAAPLVAQILFDGKKAQVADGRESHSLQVVAKYVKTQIEQLEADVIADIEWSPESTIKTEAGKEWFSFAVKSLGGFEKEHFEASQVTRLLATIADKNTSAAYHDGYSAVLEPMYDSVIEDWE